ncbi:MAG TPA: glycosyltransferase family 87 protein [Bryobacteraceae bacterium]
MLFGVVVAVAAAHRAWDAHFDFGIFYYAAHIVLDGARQSLYDLPTQRAFEAQFHRPVGFYFCHPPAALLPFLAIAKLPIEVAFIILTVTSVALLVLSVQVLARHARLQCGNWPVLLSLAFMPVSACLGQGQLSLFVLAAYVLTYSLWRKGRFFLGGVVLAVATIKFQLVIGFIAVLIMKRKWRELLGFASGSAVMVAISALMIGLTGLLRYPVFLLQGGPNSGAQFDKMANWRGLLSLVGADRWMVIAALSLLTILFAARLWQDLDTGFSAALLAAMLVSYHFSPQDLSLFLIPAFLSVRIGFPREQLLPLALSSLLLPEILAAFGGHYALLAIPLGLCLWWIGQRSVGSPSEIAMPAVTQ